MLRKVQMQEVANRLSERNCIKIIQKLIDTKAIEVIYTKSGKEYVTPKQLRSEILDELMSHGGRISVGELPNLLDVDILKIEEQVQHVIRSSKAFVIGTQLIAP